MSTEDLAMGEKELRSTLTSSEKDAERQRLQDALFGTGSVAQQPNSVQTYSENKKSPGSGMKLERVKKEIMDVMVNNGYSAQDKNIISIIANLMANLGRLKY